MTPRSLAALLLVLAGCGDRKSSPPPIENAPTPRDAAAADAAVADAAVADASAVPTRPLTVQCGAEKTPVARGALYPMPADYPLRAFPHATIDPTTRAELVMPVMPAKYGDELEFVGNTIAANRERSVQLYDAKLENPREVKLDLIPGRIAISPDGATVAVSLHPDDDQDFPTRGVALIDVATGKETARIGMGYIGDLAFVSNTELVVLGHVIAMAGQSPDVFERYDIRTKRTLARYRLAPIRDPKLAGLVENTAPYIGQSTYGLRATFRADGTVVLPTRRAEYKSRLKHIDGELGYAGLEGPHPLLVSGVLQPGRFAATATVAIAGYTAIVNSCVIVARSDNDEHFAWIFDGAKLERVELPADVTAIASNGNWLVFGFEDGRVARIDASDWSHHTIFTALDGFVDGLAIDAEGNVIVKRGATLRRWPIAN